MSGPWQIFVGRSINTYYFKGMAQIALHCMYLTFNFCFNKMELKLGVCDLHMLRCLELEKIEFVTSEILK